MTPDEELKAYKILVGGCFSLELNMNDTFAFAAADSESMTEIDVERMLPLIAKYGHHALTAYVAVKCNIEPITCKCRHDSEPYQEAKKEVLALKETWENFLNPDFA